VWDPGGTRVLATMEGPGASMLSVSRDGSRVITGDIAGATARVWEAGSGRAIAELAGDGESRLMAVDLSPDGRRAITSTLGFDLRQPSSPLDTNLLPGEVRSWVAGSGRRLATLEHNAGAQSPTAAFSPDGRRALLTSLDGPAPVWDLRSPRPERTLRARAQIPGEVVDVAWSGDGRLMAMVDRISGGVAYLFDARTGTDVAELRGHRGEIRSLDFSPDSRWVATAGVDRTARIWEAATGKPMMELRGHTGPLLDARFAADGRHVLTTAEDGTARIHDCLPCAGTDDLLALVPSRVSAGRSLTPSERREYLHE
jgi:WD40 repeat protein